MVRAMGPVKQILIVMVVSVLGTLFGTRVAHAQMPVQNVTIPVPPIHGGPPAVINLNPQSPPPGQQLPVQKPFTYFGLKQPRASGLCTQVTPTYIALLNGSQQFQVFTLPAGFIPPQALMPGRQIIVVYQVLNNGLNQVMKVIVRPLAPNTVNTVSGATVPNPQLPGLTGPNIGAPNVSAPSVTAPSIGAPNLGAPH